MGGGGQGGRGVGGFGLIEERKNFNRYVVVQFYPANFIHVHIVIFELVNLSPAFQTTEMPYTLLYQQSCVRVGINSLLASFPERPRELARTLWYQQ